VDLNALHLSGIAVATDVIPALDDEAPLAPFGCLVGKDSAEKAGANDQIIIHFKIASFLCYTGHPLFLSLLCTQMGGKKYTLYTWIILSLFRARVKRSRDFQMRNRCKLVEFPM
jgi:hypothetical protein